MPKSVSVASVWEAVIKQQLNKLDLPSPAADYLVDQVSGHGARLLPIDADTIRVLGKPPLHHRDPFDRLIIAHAIQHDLTLVTADRALEAYPVRIAMLP